MAELADGRVMLATSAAAKVLRMLNNGPRIYAVGSSTLQALVRREYVEAGSLVASAGHPVREYRITPRGRAALLRAKQQEATDAG